MIITARTVLAIIALMATGGFIGIRAQQNETIYDKDIKILKFEELRYPQLAKTAHIEGNVTEANAISGPKVLVPACLNNVKKWRFQPNTQRMAVVVYSFSLPPASGGLAKVSPCFEEPISPRLRHAR